MSKRAYEVVIHDGLPLPRLEFEQSASEADFIDMRSNPRRRQEWSEWCRDALAAGMQRLGLKPRRAGA